ncbi:MAG: alanine racemase [Myxococcota bacterium]|jgi:alanine racemase|nr:alanine racemase [Myxococcota bacterium]
MTSDSSTGVARIDLAALRENLATATRVADGREVIAVVKADAYGHGAATVARALADAHVKRLAVLSIDEAVSLREAGIVAPQILVLSGLHTREDAREVAARGLTPVLHDARGLELASEAAKKLGAPLAVQVEVDTAMARMGVARDEAVELLAHIGDARELDLDGVFTHFSRADETDLGPSLEQLREFRDVLARAGERGVAPRCIHAANSAGLLAGKTLADAFPEATAVRPGIMLYGVRPAAHFDAPLRAVMQVEARVVRVQQVPADTPVGYGATWSTREPSRIATLAIGYADGVACASAGRAQVWLAGRRRPVVGRVSMDYVGVDLGPETADDPVRPGDVAVMFGNAGRDADGIAVEEVASWSDTIPYEPLVRVGARIARQVVGG